MIGTMRKPKKVESYKTAIHRKKMSAPMRWYKENHMLFGDVLDFGAGQDVHKYAKYDPYYYPDPWPLQNKWHVVTCNYVFNVIENVETRREVLRAIKSLVKPYGYALVAIYRRSKRDTLTTKGFQSGWSPKQWESFFTDEFRRIERLPAKGLYLWRLFP